MAYVTGVGYVKVTPEEWARRTERRFWAKVGKRRAEQCWPWRGARVTAGYGAFSVFGRQELAHRYSWRLHFGAIPRGANGTGLSVLHGCDNPPCVNPAHLFLGTRADNMLDAVSKGRVCPPHPCGEEHPRAKLSANAVREIRARVAAGESHRALSRAFGVCPQQISKVALKRAWNHVKARNLGATA